MLKIWKNTNTLDGLVEDLPFTESCKEAGIALLGSKTICLEDFPRLRGIFRAGVSRDNIPMEEAKQKGIRVAFPSPRTVEFIYEETACFTCHLILKMLYLRVGRLSPWEKFPRPALGDQHLLVIGKGNIGRRVQKKMELFMRVSTYDILENGTAELDRMLQTADAVSLHIPNLPGNRDFLDADRLAMMKDGAVLVNTARGALVSEEALYRELKRERLAAAFDVFWKEPYEGKLKELPADRFFMTPHVASTCDAFLKGAAEDLREFVCELGGAQ